MTGCALTTEGGGGERERERIWFRHGCHDRNMHCCSWHCLQDHLCHSREREREGRSRWICGCGTVDSSDSVQKQYICSTIRYLYGQQSPADVFVNQSENEALAALEKGHNEKRAAQRRIPPRHAPVDTPLTKRQRRDETRQGETRQDTGFFR